jgi:Co/Zn/Cd efflux system component
MQDYEKSEGYHGPELNTISTLNGPVRLSIYEHGMPPHFRLSGEHIEAVIVTTKRDTGMQAFAMENKGEYWQSVDSIPEPHEFAATVTITYQGKTEKYDTHFAEYSHYHGHDHVHEHGGHSHALVHESITRSKDGVRVVSRSFVVLTAAALLQTVVFFSTNSLSLLADLIHNFGDALTAIPLGAAFLLKNHKAEKVSGYFVVAVIFISAVVVAIEAITRLINPEPVTNFLALTVAGLIGFAGNEIAAIIRLRGGKRLNSPALAADGMHARVDGWVSLSVVASAVLVALGLPIADPLIGLGMTAVILRITWQSFNSIRRS